MHVCVRLKRTNDCERTVLIYGFTNKLSVLRFKNQPAVAVPCDGAQCWWLLFLSEPMDSSELRLVSFRMLVKLTIFLSNVLSQSYWAAVEMFCVVSGLCNSLATIQFEYTGLIGFTMLFHAMRMRLLCCYCFAVAVSLVHHQHTERHLEIMLGSTVDACVERIENMCMWRWAV